MKLSWALGILALLAALAGCTTGTQQMMESEEHMEGEWMPEEMAAMEKERA